jgi:di/tricarboxylate transporter
MIPLSTVMEKTGAADKMAMTLINTVGQSGPYALLLGLFVLTVAMGQLISNTATALIIIPVAISAAAETHVSLRPLLMAVTVAAAASFLTPIATPANMMVMEPGGYRFGDYWKFGLTLVIWYLVVTVVIIPLIWRF